MFPLALARFGYRPQNDEHKKLGEVWEDSAVNKSIIGASAASVLVVGYVGASWALGRAVHSGFDTWEQEVARQPLAIAKVAERKYTPGVFSSVEEVTFELNGAFFDQLKKSRQPEQQQSDDEASPPMRSTLRNDVKHCPFPSFTGVGTARIDTKFVWSKEVRAKLDEFLPGREPVEISTLLGLLGGASSHVTSPAFDFKDEKTTLGWQGFVGDFSVDRHMGSIGCAATSPGFSVTGADGVSVKVETLKLTCDGERVFDALYDGTVNFEIAALETSAKGVETPMRLQKLSYSSDVRADGQYVDMVMKLGIGTLHWFQNEISDATYHVSLHHLHGPTYGAWTRKMQNAWLSSISDPTALRGLDGAFAELLPQLLEHSPQLVIDHIGFTAPEGEFGIKGTAELPGFHKDDLATPQSRAALMGKIVANADVWISEALLNKDWSGPTEKAEVSNEGPGQAEAMRRQVAAFEQQGFVTRKDGQLHTHIEFKGGALTANGKPLR